MFEFDQKSSFDLAPSGYTLTLLLLGKKNINSLETNEPTPTHFLGGLGAAAAGFLAFSSTTSSSRAFSDNVAYSVVKALALDQEEMLEESEFESTPEWSKY